MTPSLILAALVFLAADSAAPSAFEFKDSAAYEGRPTQQYRAIDFRDQPIRPLAEQRTFEAGAMYGLVGVGNSQETALTIVWIPKAQGGPELWLDANADGKLAEDERHAMPGRDLEIPASFALQKDATPSEGDSSIIAAQKSGPSPWVTRTLLIRRSTLGDGLRYSVRGYAQGRLKLGDQESAVLLIDGNANARFDSIGQDRVWIDLDADGRFDPLTEQYPLGKPITRGSDVYVIRSDATASAVVANLRSAGQGKLLLTLSRKSVPSTKVSAELISDLGELVVIDKLEEAVAVPFGQYRISGLRLAAADSSGQTWTYNFSAERTKIYAVSTGRETTVALLKRLIMKISLDLEGGKAAPGQSLSIRPKLIADGSLYLSSCTVGAEGDSRSAEGNAEILLLAPDEKIINRGLTGFS